MLTDALTLECLHSFIESFRPLLSSAIMEKNFGRCKARLDPLICISPRGLQFSGTAARICCSTYIPLAKVHSVFRLRGLFYVSPPNLIYSTYPMAELNICGYLAAKTGGGSDGAYVYTC